MNGDETPEDRHQRERHGVSGDPTPDHEYGDSAEDLTPDIEPIVPTCGERLREGFVSKLADETPLTEQQARAWILRDVQSYNPEDTAERMQVTESTMYGHLSQARKKIREADRLLTLVDELTE